MTTYRFTHPGSDERYVAIERDGEDVFDAVLYDGDTPEKTIQPLLDAANQQEGENLQISFEGEAYETFQNLLLYLKEYGVTVTTLDGEEIEGVLVGPDHGNEWGDAVKIYPVEDDEYKTVAAYEREGAIPRSVRVGDVHVH